MTTFLFKSAAHCFLVINILFESPKLRIRNTTLKRRCNNINGYINLTWYKWHSQRKIYHQAIKFQISKCIIIACFCFHCRMFFHVALDGPLNFGYTQWNMRRCFDKHATQWYFGLYLLSSAVTCFAFVGVSTLYASCWAIFLGHDLENRKTQFLPNGFSATATAYVRLAFQVFMPLHVLGRILFSSGPATLIRMILAIRQSCVHSHCPSPCYFLQLMKT